MAAKLTFKQVKEMGRAADWEHPENHYRVRYEPEEGGLLWIVARDSPYPGAYPDDIWIPLGGEPPADGWQHIVQPCDCIYCAHES